MDGIYDTTEAVLMWGTVFLAFWVVVYLAYLQYRKLKHRRAHHRHRARRAMRHSHGHGGGHQPSHSHQA
jgi:hypothetical protein